MFRFLIDSVVLLAKWLVALALVAGIALAFFVYHRLDEEVRSAVEAQLARKYPQLRVSVRRAQLVRGEGIRVGGLSIVEPNHAGPQEELLYVDELFVHCDTDPRKLLDEQLDVTRLTIRKPIVRAVRRADGRWSAAQLLPLPKFGDGMPLGVVEGGVLELVDLTGAAPTKLVLRDAHIKWSPAEQPPAEAAPPRRLLRVEGRVAGDHVRSLSFEGLFDAGGDSWSLAGGIDGLDVSPELRASLPLAKDERLAMLCNIRAKAEAQFRISWQSAADASQPGVLDFDVAGRVTNGRLEDPRLPYPLTDLAARFRANRQGVMLWECTARHGPSSLRFEVTKTGIEATGPLRVQASTERLTLDPKMLELLPAAWASQWHNFMPAGEVDVDAVLSFDGQTWRPEVTLRCANVGFTYHKFPYRLERGRGELKLVDRRLTVDLTAAAGNEEVRILGDFALDGPRTLGWTEIRGNGIRIDDRLLRSLPDNLQAFAKSLHPGGRMNVYARCWKEVPEEGPMRRHVILNLQEGQLRYDKFPYPLADIYGTVEIRDDLFLFHDDLRAANDTARITCKGQLTPGAEGGELTLNFHGETVPIDEELRDALNPASQRLFNDMKPRGMLRIDSEVRYRLSDKQLSVWVRGEPLDDTASIEPAYFPYRLDKLHGTFTFADGKLVMEHLRGEHGRTQLSAFGECTVDPQGGWRLSLDRVFVDRLQVDRDLLNALPEKLKKSAGELEPGGQFNLRGACTLVGGVERGKPPDAEWNVTVDCHNNSLHAAVPITGIHGSVWLVGRSTAGRFHSTGEMQLDSVSYRDFQATEVFGPLWVDNEQVLFGFWADRRKGQKPERHMTAKLYGGSAMADGWVVFGDEPEYAFLATLSKADLARIAQERLPGFNSLSGEVLATVDLRGKGRNRTNLAGRGSIQLRNADIYQLQAMASLLKVVSLKVPDSRAFTKSDINFVLQGEHCYLERIDLDGDAFSLQGRGELNLSNDALALVFRAVVGSDSSGLPTVRQLLGAATQQILLIHVDGTLQNPQVRREAFPGVNQVLEQLQAEFSQPLAPRTPSVGAPTVPPPAFPFEKR
jgi:hypothetical protein